MPRAKKLNTKALYFTDKLRESFSTLLEYPCTVVEAPMGYGKTTAVKETLAAIDADIIWQSVYDQGVAEFWSGFCQAVSDIDKSCSQNLRKMGMPKESLMKRETMLLLEAMHIPKKTFLIIDDFHFVKAAEADDFLDLFVRNMPPNLHLIIITRAAVFKNRSELQLKGLVNQINTQALKLSPLDIKKYFHLCGIKINEEEQSQIYRRTEGWISALYLLVLEYELYGSFILTRNISELVFQTVYEPLDNEIKSFLKTVCFFDEFNLEQAEYMGQKNARQLLDQLLDCNAFIKQDKVSRSYIFHNIFASCIREQFKLEPAETQRETWRRMGELHFENNEYLSAMKNFYQAQDFDGFLSALEQDKGDSIYNEQKEMLIKHYHECPLEVKKRHPIAILVFAITMITNFNELELYEDSCIEFLLCIDNNPTLTVEDKEQLMGEYELIRGVSAFNDLVKMGEYFAKAAAMLKSPSKSMSNTNSWTFGSPSVLYLYFRESGGLKEMIEFFGKTKNYNASTSGHGSGSRPVLKAEWYYFIGEFENAEIMAYKAIPEARANEQLDIVLCAFFILARLALVKGDFSRAQELMTEMRNEIKQTQAYALIYTIELCDAYIYACLGQANKIPSWLIEGEYTKKMFFPSIGFANLVCGKALMCQGNAIRLLGLSEQFMQQASIFPNLLAIIYTEIYVAMANYRLFRTDAAIKALQRALDMAMPDMLLMPFVENTWNILPIFDILIRDKRYTELIKEIMMVYKQYNKSMRQINEKHFAGITPQLTVREKEIALLVIEGLNNREIGHTLYISPDTVKHDLKIIFSKMEINSRALLTREMIS